MYRAANTAPWNTFPGLLHADTASHTHGTEKPESSRQNKQHLLSPGVSLSWRLLRTAESLERSRRGAGAAPRLCPHCPSPTLGKGNPPFGLPYLAALAQGTQRAGKSSDDFRDKLLLSLPAVKASSHKQQLNSPPRLFHICRHFIAAR